MALRDEAKKFLGDRVQIVASFPNNFEILPPKTDKKTAVEVLEKMLSIPRERMIAFGDWDNDVGMLSSVGMGIAMANGSDKAKAAAKFVTKDNNSDGIYYALHDYLNII